MSSDTNSNVVGAIPVLHISSSTASEEFYLRLGFQKTFAYRFDDKQPDPCYMGVKREGALIHLSSFSGDGVSGNCIYIRVKDVDALYKQFEAIGVKIDLVPTDQTWGNREMYLQDLDKNSLRFIQEKS